MEAQKRNQRVWWAPQPSPPPFSHLSSSHPSPKAVISFLCRFWYACHCAAKDKAFPSWSLCVPVCRMQASLRCLLSFWPQKNTSKFSSSLCPLPLNLPIGDLLTRTRPLPAQHQLTPGSPSFSFLLPCSQSPSPLAHFPQLPNLCTLLPHPPSS